MSGELLTAAGVDALTKFMADCFPNGLVIEGHDPQLIAAFYGLRAIAQGHTVTVPKEPTETMLASLDARNPPMGPPEKLTEEYAARWRERHRRANADTYRTMLAACK